MSIGTTNNQMVTDAESTSIQQLLVEDSSNKTVIYQLIY